MCGGGKHQLLGMAIGWICNVYTLYVCTVSSAFFLCILHGPVTCILVLLVGCELLKCMTKYMYMYLKAVHTSHITHHVHDVCVYVCVCVCMCVCFVVCKRVQMHVWWW